MNELTERIKKMTAIIETKIDNRGLKAYNLRLGEIVTTDFGDGEVCGLIIVESKVNSFYLNKGQKNHMVQVKLESGTVVGQDITTMRDKMSWISDEMAEKIFEDKGF